MDISTLGINPEQIVGGIAAVLLGIGWFKKKFSFDNLEISKSEAERELIELLREQISIASKDFSELKEKFNSLEEVSKTIGRERDEALQANTLAQADIKRFENKIIVLEGIIKRLSDALEIASDKLNEEIDSEEES